MANTILYAYYLNFIMYDKHNLLLYLKLRGAYYTQEININFNLLRWNTISERYDQL